MDSVNLADKLSLINRVLAAESRGRSQRAGSKTREVSRIFADAWRNLRLDIEPRKMPVFALVGATARRAA